MRSQLDYEAGELCQVWVSGTITNGDGVFFDPFYWTSRSYGFVMDAIPRDGQLTWEAGGALDQSAWRGSYHVQIQPLDDLGPKVRFTFLQRNLVGHVRTTTTGRGTVRLDHPIRLENFSSGYEGSASVTRDSLRKIRLHHLDEYVVSDDDNLTLAVDHARYWIRVTPKGVFETIVCFVSVSRSDDPSCPRGKQGLVAITEPKGRAGKGKVSVDIACPGHKHHGFTERRDNDVVRVVVKGRRPEPPPDTSFGG